MSKYMEEQTNKWFIKFKDKNKNKIKIKKITALDKVYNKAYYSILSFVSLLSIYIGINMIKYN